MYDAVIVGGGIVGTMTALLLAKETSLRIALIEQKPFSLHWHPDQYGERTSAISLATKSIFEKVECFAAMEKKRIFPYRKMHVWDIEDKGELHFSATDTKEKCLGYMIEDEVMRIALFEKLQQSSVDILSPYHLQAIHKKDLYVELVSGDHNVIHTKLLIGADGANSWVRETLQISYKNLDYDQTAVILNVKTELPHEQTARQRFLSTGPLAFLPLDDPHICSIVWSCKNSTMQDLLQMSEQDFKDQLAMAFQYRLGNVTDVLSTRKHFPLRMRHVDHYVEDRIALVGDAAHTIHPLAGQGVNLGLQDAATLTEVIRHAHRKNRDFFSFATLRRYERARKSQTELMLKLVNGLNALFSNDAKLLREVRNSGFNILNRWPWMKNFLVNCATGYQS